MALRSVTATAVVALVVSATAAPDVHAGPSMTSNWTSTTLEQGECIERAQRVMRDVGLNQNLKVVGQSVFTQSGGYTAVVRCISEKGLVYFVVGGPTLDEAKRRMRSIYDKF